MGIGPIVRAIAGENKPGAPKALELKSGQVVRGTVLSVSEDGQEAVLNVQGVKLHASLETPLQPGQTTLLQVQPQTEDAVIRMKPIQGAVNGELTGAGLSKALEALGMDNTPANRELLQMMQSAGIPLTKENLAQLSALNSQKPASVNLSEWIQSVGIALSRSLPLTAETVSGLHQAVFGPQLHVLLSSLEEQITTLLQQMNTQGGEGQKGSLPGTSLAQGNPANPGVPSLIQGDVSAVQASAGRAGDGQALGNAVSQAATQGMPAAAASGSGLSQLQEDAASHAASRQAAGTSPAEVLLPENGRQMAMTAKGDGRELLQKLQQVLTELKGAAHTESAAPPAAAARQAAAEVPVPATGMASAAGTAQSGEAPAAASPAAHAPTQTESWVGRVLKLLGAEHEQQVLRAAAADGKAAGMATAQQAAGQAAPEGATLPPQAQQQAVATAQAQPAVANAAAAQQEAAAAPLPAQAQPVAVAALAFTDAGGDEAASVRDTLKGLLLQVAAVENLPEPLREAARQIVQQLTGQQLLLTTDRTTPFAQVTMFLPFTGPDGEETASVQIEARRGRKGELDAANCRLWFDLQMKSLGQLMVDVQVADRKVILRILTEVEAVGAYLETKNEEVEQALNAAGYQLRSLKTEPLITSIEEEGPVLELGRSMTYAPTPYKGVDYRI